MSRRLLLAAVAASIALSACGGSSDPAASGSQAPATTAPAATSSAEPPGTAALAAAAAPAAAPAEPTTTTAAPATTTTVAPTTTTKPAVTKAAYVQQANSICQTMNTRMEALADPGEDLDDLITLFHQSKQIMTETLTKLRALPTPPGQEAALAAIWAKVDQIVADVDDIIAAVQAGDLDKAGTLIEQLAEDSDDANTASIAYGMTVCGE